MKSKKGAMEMSVGTIVTIVLLMSVLVLGIFLVQQVFGSGTDAIDQIDAQLENEINKMFSETDSPIITIPNNAKVAIKRGSEASGVGFKIQNPSKEEQTFTYAVKPSSSRLQQNCGSTMTPEVADSYLLNDGEGYSTTIGGTQVMSRSELVLFSIPKEAPKCTLTYYVTIRGDKGFIEDFPIYLTIK